ncbi:plasma membrane calcium [Aspergillus melleus]|uniref:Plasma membrane calcium n=1 Tax=Aspergillus melleus TaxID=138277 RepID=A0ACC3B3I9_9EURO|nr:plasma membrane calcium [Aspergillus melleus]
MAKPSIPFYTNEPLPEALAPDPQDENEKHITDNKFAFSPGQLNKLLNPKSLSAFHAMGGLQGLEYGLQTDLTAGLSADESTLLGYATLGQIREITGSGKKSSPEYFTGASMSLSGTPSLPFSDRRRKSDRQVKVIRSGKTVLVHISELNVGDVVHLEAGDSAPCDGVVITAHGIKCDESSTTGESDQVEKVSGTEAWVGLNSGGPSEELDTFIISGSKVLEGLGTYLVTSVGTHSTYGKILSALGTDSDPTPLQVKLSRLANWIGWFGLSAALLLFVVLFIRFLVQLRGNDATPAEKGQKFMDILIVAVTVIVVAIPEGLPLAVTLALAFATARMLKENNLVRLLRACETMGNATVICSDKTGTLTKNRMTVVAGLLSTHELFGELPASSPLHKSTATVSEALQKFTGVFVELLRANVSRNSTAFELQNDNGKEFSGNKTEVALLQFAESHLGLTSLAEEQASMQLTHVYPFDSIRKAMAVVYKTSTGYRLLVKGAAELVLRSSTEVVLADKASADTIKKARMREEDHQAISDMTAMFAETGLRTIGVAYRDFHVWPPEKENGLETNPTEFETVVHDLIWIGVLGIQDPLRPEVAEAIRTCHAAGIQVKMVTGDNLGTARAIAASCGIKSEDGLIMEGSVFRKLGESELDNVLPRLQVLARSSPDDKRLLVERLRCLGEIVAVTGDGTNDGPALKSADVGFSMGMTGTEVAREASSIVLLDDSFKSIFQITVNITAVLITVVTAIYNEENESVFKAIQLLWLNLIMDTFAALALATDPPTADILNRPPTPRNAPLFTATMWKMILGQSVYKLALCFTLYFAGGRILNLNTQEHTEQLKLDTIIFNTFVWMQIFNELNCRRLDNRFNIFEGIQRNYWFVAINAVMT